MRKKSKRLILLMMAGLFVLPSLLNVVLPPASAYAAADSPEDQLERWLYYRAMRACFEKPDWGRTAEIAGQDDQDGSRTAGEINDGDLLPGGYPYQNSKEGVGYLAKNLDDLDGDDGTVQCSDNNLWKEGASIFGFPNVLGLICAMNDAATALDMGNKIDPEGDAGDCEEAASIRFHHVEDSGSAFQRMLTKALENPAASEHGGDGDRPPFDFNSNKGTGYTYKSMLYLLGKNSLETFCGGSLDSANANDSYDGDDKAVSVYIVQSDGTIKESGVGDAGFSHSYGITKKDNESDNVNDVYYKNGGNSNEADDRNCADMARWTREGAREYSEWVKQYGDEQNEDDDSGTGGNTDPEEAGTTCNVDGIGWIICPVASLIAKFNDALFVMLEQLLGVSPSMFDTSGKNAATYNTWSSVKNFANVAFVIAFLIIIYSQITGVGISNYGIKKLLPRIALAAILVNLSFWICAIAVDASNIIGSSLHDLLKDQASRAATEGSNSLGTWDNVTGWLLSGGAIVGGGIAATLTIGSYGFLGALALLIPFAVVALIAALTVVAVLVARQALIIILVVLAPLAFVAYLLPNTESWFDKWRKTFFTLLLIYPIVGLLFGGSQLAAAIIRAGADDAFVYILSLVVQVIPLFMTPFLLKVSGGILGKVGAFVNNPNRGPFDRMKNFGKEYAGMRKQERLQGALNGQRRFTGLPQRMAAIRQRRMNAAEANAKRAEAEFGLNNQTAYNYAKQASDDTKAAEIAENRMNSRIIAGRDRRLAMEGHIAKEELDLQNKIEKAELEELKVGSLDVSGTNLEGLAQQARNDYRESRVADGRTRAAEHMQDKEFAEELAQTHTVLNQATGDYEERMSGLAQRMGGVDPHGARTATAAAKAEITKEMMKNIENIKSTMDFSVASNPEALKQRFKAAESDEERAAVLQLMYQNGSPGVKATRETLAEWTSDPNADQNAILNIKEIMKADQGFQRAGRDFEVWSNNEHAVNGQPHANFGAVRDDTSVWADISAQRFASMNKSSQMHALKMLEDKGLVDGLIQRIAADSTAMGQIKEEPLDFVRTRLGGGTGTP